MPYAILRFQKRKAGGVAACERHNERKKEAYKSNPDIDMERSKNNYHLVAPPRYTYKKEINRMVAEAGCRTRKDSVMMVETLITASPEFMNQLPPEEQKAYFTMALDFISERVGEKNILSAVVHMDERTPHMHLCFVPITPDNKLSAKIYFRQPEDHYPSGRPPTMSGCPHGGISLNGVNPQWKRNGNTSPHGSINWAAGLINSMRKSCLPSPTSTPLTQGKSVTRLWN